MINTTTTNGITKISPVVVRKSNPLVHRQVKVTLQDEEFSLDERTARILDNVRQDAERLTDPKMRELWLDATQTFALTGDVNGLINVCKWRRTPVDIETFIFDEAYLGIDKSEVFPGVLELLHELDTDNYNECVLGGALGIGKTFAANIFTGRTIYKISCMRHPQTTYGLASRSGIAFTIQSIRLGTAKKAVFQEFGVYIRNSPYFSRIYPFDKYITSELLFREQRISVQPVSSATTGVISMNVIGGQLDEANFFQKITKSKSSEAEADGSFDQAKKLYLTLARRRKSRFVNQGRVPGMFFIISSAKLPGDFTIQKASEAKMLGGTDEGIYVWTKARWDVQPPDRFMAEKFRVQVGNEVLRSKVLHEQEEGYPGCKVIDVPMDFYPDFMADVDGALRDFAGETSVALRPFMPNRDKVRECMELAVEQNFVNPFQYDTYDLSFGVPQPDKNKLRLDIDAPRACHVDLSLTRDAAGLAIGHVIGIKAVERMTPSGNMQIDFLPVVAYDVILRIIPPPGGEIEFAMIRKLIKDMRDVHNLPIRYVTFDGFQSVDSRQILKTEGFLTDYLSVDTDMERYNSLKDGIYDVRVMLHQNQLLAGELAGLQYSTNRSGSKEKVDHRPDGTKDVADAVCGVYAFLLNRKSTWRDIKTFNNAPNLSETEPKVPEKPEEREKHREVMMMGSGRGVPTRRIIVTRSDPVRVTPTRL